MVSRLARTARSAVASLVVLSLAASTLPPRAAAHDEHGAEHPAATLAGLDAASLWSWIAAAWSSLRGGREICQDCNLPVDDGCRCLCYSGGYDPTNPDCL